jgi:hypothetical protein
MIEKVTLVDLHKLAYEANKLAWKMQHATPFKLSKKQRTALNDALRTLDFDNRYSAGDKLRVAFQVELDAVKANKKRQSYGKAC